MPGFDLTIGDYTLVPNPFWGGALFPLVILLSLLSWPWFERWRTGDRAFHNVLERPRDNPWRTAVGTAVFTWVVLVFVAGSADRVNVRFGLSYTAQIWAFRGLVVVAPFLVYLITKRVCEELKQNEEVERERERVLSRS